MQGVLVARALWIAHVLLMHNAGIVLNPVGRTCVSAQCRDRCVATSLR